ncbi:membrane protein [Microbacterium phage Cece]|nr:membrane protein [Microbacterium phage Cece]
MWYDSRMDNEDKKKFTQLGVVVGLIIAIIVVAVLAGV